MVKKKKSGVSNKVVMGLLFVCVVVVVVGALLSIGKLYSINWMGSLTGAATSETGTTAVNIQGAASLSVTDTTITFVTGYYNTSCTSNYATVYSNGTTGECWLNATGVEPNYTNHIDHHVIQNNGTLQANLSLDTDNNNASDYFCAGGCATTKAALATVNFSVFNNEAGSCDAGKAGDDTNLLNDSVEKPNDICTAFDFQDASDELNLSYVYTVPYDAPSGTKTLTITYTAVANS
jgi:hypothetical protein